MREGRQYGFGLEWDDRTSLVDTRLTSGDLHLTRRLLQGGLRRLVVALAKRSRSSAL